MKIKKQFNNFRILTVFIIVFFALFFSTNTILAKEINLKNTIYLVNQSRNANGLNSLFINPTLIKVATDKANNMISHHYFAHTSPQGVDPWYWFKQNNYQYEYAGENLAINYNTAESQHQAWMNSPTHRRNILNPNYTEIGIATANGYIDHKPASITVQVFGKPQSIKSSSTILSSENNLTKISPTILGAQFNYPQQTSYLKEMSSSSFSTNKTTSAHNYKKNILPTNNKLFLFTKKHIRDLSWLVILFLGIIIIRELVLSTINNPTIQRHSITNLILLLTLWSILIGM